MNQKVNRKGWQQLHIIKVGKLFGNLGEFKGFLKTQGLYLVGSDTGSGKAYTEGYAVTDERTGVELWSAKKLTELCGVTDGETVKFVSQMSNPCIHKKNVKAVKKKARRKKK